MRLMSVSLILAASLLAGCSRGGVSDPALAKQLVGHWSTSSNDHLYFGAASAGNATGSYILVHPDGKAFDHHYRIDSTDGSKRVIETTLLFKDGDSREQSFKIAADGRSMESRTMITGIETTSELTKVDEATAP